MTATPPPGTWTPTSSVAVGSSALADLCHRVRTPLNGILGNLELLLEGDLSDESRELARVAQESARSLHLVFENDLDSLRSPLD